MKLQSRRLRLRQRRIKTKKNYASIQHHHLLLRMETRWCPSAVKMHQDIHIGDVLSRIVQDINMIPLAKPQIYYVKSPDYKEGLTAIMPIQTSHIALHFWTHPERRILKGSGSKCLLEFDLYTCGSLTIQQIQKVLHHLAIYGPTQVDITLLIENGQ